MNRAQSLGASLVLVLAPSVFGQTPSAPALTLQQAQAMALKNHPQILASQANLLRSGQIVRENKAAYYPTLNGDFTAAQAQVNSRIGAGLLNDPRLFNHVGVGVTLAQLVTDSGRTPNLVASSKFQEKAAMQDEQATKYDVAVNVSNAYFEALLGRELVRVADETVKARQSVVDQVAELAKNKLRSDVDLSFAQVNLTDAKLMLLRAQDRLESAYATLAQAMGQQKAVDYDLAGVPMPPEPASQAEPLITQAFQNRPELASIRLQRQADEKFERAERDLKLPTVTLTAVGGLLPYIDPGNVTASLPNQYEAIALNVQVPIFNGFLFSARRQAAAYQLQSTNERVRDLEDRISRDVRMSWERARTAYQAIAATEDLVKQANLALDLAQGRYNLGLSSIVELSQAQLGQTQALVENVSAKYDYQEANAVLQYNLGLLR